MKSRFLVLVIIFRHITCLHSISRHIFTTIHNNLETAKPALWTIKDAWLTVQVLDNIYLRTFLKRTYQKLEQKALQLSKQPTERIQDFKRVNLELRVLKITQLIQQRGVSKRAVIVIHSMSTYRDSESLIMRSQELVHTTVETQWLFTTPSTKMLISNHAQTRQPTLFKIEIIQVQESTTLTNTKQSQTKNSRVVQQTTSFFLHVKIIKFATPESKNNLELAKAMNELQLQLDLEVISTNKKRV